MEKSIGRQISNGPLAPPDKHFPTRQSLAMRGIKQAGPCATGDYLPFLAWSGEWQSAALRSLAPKITACGVSEVCLFVKPRRGRQDQARGSRLRL